MVTTVDRGRYTCDLEGRSLTAVGARELGRRGVIVGDRVALTGDLSGRVDALARIVRVEERQGTLRRSADDGDPNERLLVANVTQMAIVTALADPPPRTGLIDRCLVAAEDEEIQPLLVLTKRDLASPDALLAYYSALELPYVVWERGAAIDEVLGYLKGEISVLVGHSGVGKSTLVNALVPSAERATGHVSSIGRGRHTSTSAIALRLGDGQGWVIDTPGIRSFGLAHIPVEDLLHGFADLLPGSLNCEMSCDHSAPMPSCALDAWCAEGHAPAARLASFRGLRASLATSA